MQWSEAKVIPLGGNMGKKYHKLWLEWLRTAKTNDFVKYLDQRRDERKAGKKVKTAHDYTPHPWSEPVPEDGYYFVYSLKLGFWSNRYNTVSCHYDVKGFSHWMHTPPVPGEE